MMRVALVALVLTLAPATDPTLELAGPATATAQAVRIDPPRPVDPGPPDPIADSPPATVPADQGGAEAARMALVLGGATPAETSFGVTVCRRESYCLLWVVNDNRRTRDYSWGPFQINYYGSLYESRTALLGEPATNISSWSRAVRNFLLMLRTYGACHWQAPDYCS